MRVFVVEDDRLVRKGFISLMPWEQFGMSVVGEAGNGEDALGFLENHEVDLLITDLAMPVMSGIDLIRVVRDKYPKVWSVILTFHQDFEFIQEALRLGAIDYIAKTELQQDKMEEVLGRIDSRIRYEMGQQGIATDSSPKQNTDVALIWISHPSVNPSSMTLPVNQDVSAEEISSGIWLQAMDKDELEKSEVLLEPLNGLRNPDSIVLMKLDGIRSEERANVVRTLQQFREHFLFYEWNGRGNMVLERSYDELLSYMDQCSEPRIIEQKLKEDWSSLQWVVNDQHYKRNVEELQQAKLSLSQLDSLFVRSSTRWERIVPGQVWTPTPEAKLSWEGWKHWLDGLRGRLASYLFKPSYSQEVLSCVWKAVESIHQDLSRVITLKDVAMEVSMSQSYLSQCFRDIVGQSFNDYVRQARMNWAKQLLIDTDKPIYWIATQTGYPNEKYFSRVFKDKTGMLPSTYRTSAHTDE